MKQGGRFGIVLLLVISLLAAGGSQWLAQRQRAQVLAQGPGGGSGTSSLSRMNSFALALLLGGLRGPLVMVLWASSEQQKGKKDLEDFDTKVEWIRLLQPDFDSVHIYQVWNKGYNISVQMASMANKYVAVLDALDYATRVDRERPANVNILVTIAQVYFDKLGKSQDAVYYRKRVRQETRAISQEERARLALHAKDPGWRRTRLDPMLDGAGALLPERIAPLNPRPADLADGEPWNDGSELQYLKPYQPFPYGISPFALALAYHKRAQVLQAATGQKHIQFSDRLVDSRPALDLDYWAKEELALAEAAELRAVGRAVPPDDIEMTNAAVMVASSQVALEEPLRDSASQDEAVFSYGRSIQLLDAALVEYERHMKAFPDTFDAYLESMEELRVLKLLAIADSDYVALLGSVNGATTVPSAERQAALARVKGQYQQALAAYQRRSLRFYTQAAPLAQALPRGYSHLNYKDLPTELLTPVMARIHMVIENALGGANPFEREVAFYERVMSRATQRIAVLDRQLGAGSGTSAASSNDAAVKVGG